MTFLKKLPALWRNRPLSGNVAKELLSFNKRSSYAVLYLLGEPLARSLVKTIWNMIKKDETVTVLLSPFSWRSEKNLSSSQLTDIFSLCLSPHSTYSRKKNPVRRVLSCIAGKKYMFNKY